MVAVLVQNFVADKAIVSSNQEVRTAQWVGNTSITRAPYQGTVDIGSQ